MNKVINWALNALESYNFTIDDESLIESLRLAGIPETEIETKSLKVGKCCLESVFGHINLGKTEKKQQTFYKWCPFDPAIMPIPEERITKNEDFCITIGETDKDLFQHAKNNETLALSLIQKYGLYLAASVDKPYLSFFQVVRNAIAINDCVTQSPSKQFILVGGDLGGIQHYIFNLSEGQSKGVSKVLRARSFNLSLFTEICQHYILHSLGLSLYCTIIDAGGRFILLAPALNSTRKLLREIQIEFDDYCLKNFAGELGLNLSYSIELGPNDFGKVFKDKIQELNHSLEKCKNRPFKNVLGDKKWQVEKFLHGDDYEKYQNGVCAISGILPKAKAGDNELSFECLQNIELGKCLVKRKYLAFWTGDNPGNNKDTFIFSFKNQTYGVTFLDSINNVDTKKYYQIQSFGENLTKDSTPRFFANKVPHYKNAPKNNKIVPFPEKEDFTIALDELKNEQTPGKGDIMDFGTLAYAGVEKDVSDQNSRFRGSHLLGVIKADVDEMGQIFSNGINDIYSLTTYSTLSRQLDLYFTAYLPQIQAEKHQYMYTVYSGGDDLFYVGEWQQSILFARTIYEKFKQYTGKNDDVHLSSAVYIMNPHHPIRTAAEMAEELLATAKNNDRDSMAIFDIVFKQKEYGALFKMAEFLDEKQKLPNSESNITSAFLHRLIQYRNMAKRYDSEKDINSLMYVPRLSYDIGRNILERDKKGALIKGKDELKELSHLLDSSNIHKFINIQFPVFYSIFRNRKIYN
jgi:CRISPR-associated protein Csm1